MGSNTFTANNAAWPIPATVLTNTAVTIECYGGGGAGGGSGTANSLTGGGCGGGGAAYARITVTGLVAGNTHAIVIGAGGTNGVAANGNPGGTTTFNNNVGGNTSTIIGANGGNGGNKGDAGPVTPGGAANTNGGTIVSYKGGNGYNQNGARGGGAGGGAANGTRAGLDATSQSAPGGGSAPGGAGNTGGTRNANGTNGLTYGGGGGASGCGNASTRRGGSGAAGYVVVSWLDAIELTAETLSLTEVAPDIHVSNILISEHDDLTTTEVTPTFTEQTYLSVLTETLALTEVAPTFTEQTYLSVLTETLALTEVAPVLNLQTQVTPLDISVSESLTATETVPNIILNQNDFIADGGSWSTNDNWSLGHVPTNTENVTFYGIVSSGKTLTVASTSNYAKFVDCTTAAYPFFISGSNVSLYCESLTLKSGMTVDINIWCAYGTTGTLITNGVSLDSSAVNIGDNSNLTLGDDLISNNNINIQGTNCSFNTANHNITCAGFTDAFLTGSCTLTLGSSTINCTSYSFGYTTLTVTENTATVNVTTSTADMSIYAGNGYSYGGTWTLRSTSYGNIKIYSNNTFGNMNMIFDSPAHSSSVILYNNITVTGALSVTGVSGAKCIIVRSDINTQRTITAATVSITGSVIFRYINGTGSANWNLSSYASGNAGGNSGITFRAPNTYYLVGVNSDLYYTDNVWSLSDDGTPDGTSVFPLPQDTVIINDNSTDGSNRHLRWYVSFIPGITASSLTKTLYLDLLGGVSLGNIVLSSTLILNEGENSSVTVDATLRYEASGELLISGVACSTQQIIIYSGNENSTVKFSNDLTFVSLTLRQGILDKNNKTISVGSFNSSYTYTRTLKDEVSGSSGVRYPLIITKYFSTTIMNCSTSTGLTILDVTDVTIDPGVTTVTGNRSMYFGSKTWGYLKIAKYAASGSYNCDILDGNNTFGKITLETPNVTYQYSRIRLLAGSTTYCNLFVANGDSTYKTYIASTSVGTRAILSRSSGTVSVTNCSIQDSEVTGGATWRAPLSQGNIDVSNIDYGYINVGWDFNEYLPALVETFTVEEATTLTVSDGNILALLSESLAIAESTNLGLSSVDISVNDSLTLTEEPTVEIPTNNIVRIGSPITIGSGGWSGSYPWTYSLSVPSDATLVLVLTGGWDSSDNLWINGTHSIGGQSLTNILALDADGASHTGGVFYKINPATGNQTLSINPNTGTLTTGPNAIVVFFKGVDTTDPFRDHDTIMEPYDGDGVASVTGIACESGDWLLGFVTLTGNSTHVWSGDVSLIDNCAGNSNLISYAENQAPSVGDRAAAITITAGDPDFWLGVLSLKPSVLPVDISVSESLTATEDAPILNLSDVGTSVNISVSDSMSTSEALD